MLVTAPAGAQTALTSCSGPSNNYTDLTAAAAREAAQHFTVTTPARVEAVRAELYWGQGANPPTGDLIVQIFPGAEIAGGGSGPTGSALGMGSIDSSTLPQNPALGTVNLASPASVMPGQTYAVVFSKPTGTNEVDLGFIAPPSGSPCPMGASFLRDTGSGGVWGDLGTDRIAPLEILGTPISTSTPTSGAACERPRKKLKRQQRRFQKAGSKAKRDQIQKNIQKTKAKLTKLGC